ncbi:MAG: 26S protease regulatory subunit, partial [Candidatus Nanohaloarchaea archaeon]
MYEKKLRELFQESKEKAEEALDEGNESAAASYYEQCGDVLMEQAKNARGKQREKKEELAEQYYELRDNLLGKSSSLDREVTVGGDEDEPPADAERFLQETDVSWEDVAGLEETKEELRESFALAAIQDKPAAVDQLHTILLYGPPGTGKSLLASAVAGSHDYPFFNVKLSQALSKYYGESGKIISTIFGAARERSPSIVFFDELDAVAFSRGGDMDEASRRVLSTLLTELSGFDAENEELMFIGATNAPWDLDPAVLSRMERTIYVPLPGEETAERILELNTVEDEVAVDTDLSAVAAECVARNFSGREVKNLATDAVRRMIDEENPELEQLSEQPVEEVQDYDLQTRPLTRDDFEAAFEKID